MFMFDKNPPSEEDEMRVQQLHPQPRVQHMDHHQRMLQMDHRQRMQNIDQYQQMQHPDRPLRRELIVHQPNSFDFAADRSPQQVRRYYSRQIHTDHNFSTPQHPTRASFPQSSLSTPDDSSQMRPMRGCGGATPGQPMLCAQAYDSPVQQLFPYQHSQNSAEWLSGMAPGAGGESQHSQQSQQCQQASQSQPDHLPPPVSQGDGSGRGSAPPGSGAADGAGEAPAPLSGTSADGQEPQDIVQTLARRKLSGMQELAALRDRRMRLEQEVSMALKEQHDSNMRSNKLDEDIKRVSSSLARSEERAVMLDEKLASKLEDLKRLRAFHQMQDQFHEKHVDSYCLEMTKMIETARAAPDQYEADNLKRVLEELKTEQQETNTELSEIDKELNLLREEYAAILEQGKDLDICSEKNLPNTLGILVADVERHLEVGEAERMEVEEKVKKMEAEKEALTQKIERMREQPLRSWPWRPALAPRVSAYTTAASSSITSSSSISHQTSAAARCGPKMSCSMERYSN